MADKVARWECLLLRFFFVFFFFLFFCLFFFVVVFVFVFECPFQRDFKFQANVSKTPPFPSEYMYILCALASRILLEPSI